MKFLSRCPGSAINALSNINEATHFNSEIVKINVQSTLFISTSLISNNRLSRSKILVPILTRKSKNR